MSRFLEQYAQIRRLVKKIIAYPLYSKMQMNDLFWLSDESSEALVSLKQPISEHLSAFQFFFNRDGLNYLSYLLEEKYDPSLDFMYSDCILLGFIPLADLKESDRSFLEKYGIFPVRKYNLIIRKMKMGYGMVPLQRKDLKLLVNYLWYLVNLFQRESQQISSLFQKQLTVYASFSNTDHTFSFYGDFLTDLDRFPRKKPCNKEFIADYADALYTNETAYLVHCYYPIKYENQSFFSSFIMVYYEKQQKYYSTILSVPKEEFSNYVFGILGEAFHQFGLPTAICVNQRDLYQATVKTLQKLQIEISYVKMTEEMAESLKEILFSEETEEESEEQKEEKYIS